MIKFELENIEIDYLSCSVNIKTIKQIEKMDFNKVIKFYLFIENEMILLDSMNYHTFALPEDKTYYDSLLVNEKMLKFSLYRPELLTGVKVRIRAILPISQTIFWQSEELFLKTKKLDSPIFEVTNTYDKGLKSKITFNSNLELNHIRTFYIYQHIQLESNEKDTLEINSNIPLNNVSILYPNLNKYGAYKVITRLYNLNNELITEDVSFYSKIHEPLPIIYKEVWQPSSNQTVLTGNISEMSKARDIKYNQMVNFIPRKIRSMYYKDKDGQYRIINIVVKL